MVSDSIRDPVPGRHAAEYAASSYLPTGDNEREWEILRGRLGGSVTGWRVLDLGGGPGQFSALMAGAGGQVVWHDISESYRKLAQDWCEHRGVRVEFQLGGLEDLDRYSEGEFDLVFNRVCWYYSANESRLYRQIRRIIRPGGYVWVHTTTAGNIRRMKKPFTRFAYRWLYRLHEATGIKLAHVPAHPERLRKWFFGSGDFEQVFFEEAEHNVFLLGRRR